MRTSSAVAGQGRRATADFVCSGGNLTLSQFPIWPVYRNLTTYPYKNNGKSGGCLEKDGMNRKNVL